MVWEVLTGVRDFFAPPDPPMTDIFGEESSMAKIEGHMKRELNWKMKVTYTLIAGVILVIVALFTPWGVVRSSDMDKKVEAAVKKLPLTQQMEEMRTEQKTLKSDVKHVQAELDAMSPMLKEIFKSSTATTICRLLAAKLRAEADTEQNKYKAVDGDYYPESRCGGK